MRAGERMVPITSSSSCALDQGIATGGVKDFTAAFGHIEGWEQQQLKNIYIVANHTVAAIQERQVGADNVRTFESVERR